MLTLNQYEGGYYTAKEASIIATLFSAVSITFALVVLDQVGMVQYFRRLLPAHLLRRHHLRADLPAAVAPAQKARDLCDRGQSCA